MQVCLLSYSIELIFDSGVDIKILVNLNVEKDVSKKPKFKVAWKTARLWKMCPKNFEPFAVLSW